jgi:hypothetical protein
MTPETLPSSTLLARGEIVTVVLLDGTAAQVKVRLLPVRHLNRYLDLRDTARESEMLEFVVLCAAADSALSFTAGATAEFVDSLSDESHAQLVEIADKLNFARAVSQAERQIATGNALLELKQRIAATMMAPVEQALRSLTQSLTTQALSAAATKKP